MCEVFHLGIDNKFTLAGVYWVWCFFRHWSP